MPTDLPGKLLFTIGGFTGKCQEVEFKKGALHYRQAEGAYRWGPEEITTPTPEAWAEFWRAAEVAGVWQWQKEYSNLNVLDGTQWSLKLEHQGRHVNCYGSNAFPGADGMKYAASGEFARFLKALQALTGKKVG